MSRRIALSLSTATLGDPRSVPGGAALEAHDLSELVERQSSSGRPYLEFIRHPPLSVGLYVLPADGDDRQQPHAEDEVYHVIEGRSRMSVGSEQVDVGPGSVIYVAAGVPHRFHDITAELRILVVFAPAESGPD
jgi:quercetin dioxygenase-like cupin family protein